MKRLVLFLVSCVLVLAAVLVAAPAVFAQVAAPAVTDTLAPLFAPHIRTLDTLPLLFAVGALGSVAANLDGPGINADTIRQQFNKAMAWLYYTSRNGVMSTTVAALPAVTIGSDAKDIKTTNATVLKNAGVANALAASDDFWTPTGAAIANTSGAAQFVRYLLCASAADAASLIRSTVAATKAACEFPNLPADGIAIVGIATIEIANGTTFTPGTTELSAAGITDTYQDGHDDDAVFALGGKLITA